MTKKAVLLTGILVLIVAGFMVYAFVSIGVGKQSLPIIPDPSHKIAPFAFVNQAGDTITEKNMDGKVCVVEYFFTTCTGICPKMNANMDKVYKEFKDKPDFLILSHTVDPATDSVPVLEKYAERYGADPKVWMFLTGPKKELYDMARHSYLLNAATGDGGNDDFIHTQMWALVDKNRQVRGFYDGLKPAEISKMEGDIRTLLKE